MMRTVLKRMRKKCAALRWLNTPGVPTAGMPVVYRPSSAPCAVKPSRKQGAVYCQACKPVLNANGTLKTPGCPSAGGMKMEIRDWLLTISMILHFSRTAWDYIDKRNDKTNERITELTGKFDALEKDVAALDAVAGNAPTHSDLSKVYESVNTLAATVNQLVGENRGQSDTLRLILNQITQKGMK